MSPPAPLIYMLAFSRTCHFSPSPTGDDHKARPPQQEPPKWRTERKEKARRTRTDIPEPQKDRCIVPRLNTAEPPTPTPLFHIDPPDIIALPVNNGTLMTRSPHQYAVTETV